uniref:Uncharacterized protein n=1 Tax=Arundo donax TaxID=35708 RepID=A0A0A9DCJ1_ARUDO
MELGCKLFKNKPQMLLVSFFRLVATCHQQQQQQTLSVPNKLG